MVDLSGDYFDTAIRYCKNCDEEHLVLEEAKECPMCGQNLQDTKHPKSGRPHKYGKAEVVRIHRTIPRDRVAELDAWLKRKIKAWKR